MKSEVRGFDHLAILASMTRRNIHGLRGVLTGASSGIGYALALELVQKGARLLVVARREDRLQALTDRLADAVGEVVPLAGDITDTAFQQTVIDRAAESFGGLDALINNAGIGAMGHFIEAAPERLRQVMEVNFFAPVELIRRSVPRLAKGQHPIIVNISSVLGHRGVPGCSEYCASKFALEGFSQSLRAELAPQGIDVLVISPARTKTEFFDQAIDANETPWPSIRGMSSEEVARRIALAVRRGQHHLVIGLGGKSLVWVSRLFPGIMDRVLARYH
jgi:short-subunit dehydrogenase